MPDFGFDPYQQYWGGMPQTRGNVTQPSPLAMALQAVLGNLVPGYQAGQQQQQFQQQRQWAPVERAMQVSKAFGTPYQPTQQTGQTIEQMTGMQLPRTTGQPNPLTGEPGQSGGYAPMVPFESQQLAVQTQMKEMQIQSMIGMAEARLNALKDKNDVLERLQLVREGTAQDKAALNAVLAEGRQKQLELQQQLLELRKTQEANKTPKTIQEGLFSDNPETRKQAERYMDKELETKRKQAADESKKQILTDARMTHTQTMMGIQKQYADRLKMIDPTKSPEVYNNLMKQKRTEELEASLRFYNLLSTYGEGGPGTQKQIDNMTKEYSDLILPPAPKGTPKKEEAPAAPAGPGKGLNLGRLIPQIPGINFTPESRKKLRNQKLGYDPEAPAAPPRQVPSIFDSYLNPNRGT